MCALIKECCLWHSSLYAFLVFTALFSNFCNPISTFLISCLIHVLFPNFVIQTYCNAYFILPIALLNFAVHFDSQQQRQTINKLPLFLYNSVGWLFLAVCSASSPTKISKFCCRTSACNNCFNFAASLHHYLV